MIRTAYLRVYEPLDAFSPSERERYRARGQETDAGAKAAARKWLIKRAMPDEGPLGLADGAFVRVVDGATLICPWRTRLRMLAGLVAFRGSIPDEVADAFVPREAAERAARELEAIGRLHPDLRSHIVHANWHVPLRWFCAFDDSERILIEDSHGLRVRYETSVETGAGRLNRALDILESSWIDDNVTETVRELSEWVSCFRQDGLLELDYGSVAGTFEADDLVDDRTASEVWACLDALTAGDLERAGSVFGSMSERWAEARAIEVAN
ncbi:MAG: hypothetical protein ACRDJV_03985 [Actinomycetota bacterium]